MVDVIHIRDKSGARNEVYIGRGSVWGNPFKIGVDGDRSEVIDKYAEWLIDTELVDRIGELVGKTLVCFCAPLSCHGDVLAEYVREHVEGVGA